MIDYDETPKSELSDGIATFGSFSRKVQRKRTIGRRSMEHGSSINEEAYDEDCFEDIYYHSVLHNSRISKNSSTNLPVCSPCSCALF
ncbi:unnamed protein product [Blepharisma stoltei]|uniref:Uncharacterized protein n=1 Tax=Blepharisma stoltei TaxID=1481888 RepID=A0AAU9JIU7_9CILI|nr:unnamed protein product [Blepharisma stoltei]